MSTLMVANPGKDDHAAELGSMATFGLMITWRQVPATSSQASANLTGVCVLYLCSIRELDRAHCGNRRILYRQNEVWETGRLHKLAGTISLPWRGTERVRAFSNYRISLFANNLLTRYARTLANQGGRLRTKFTRKPLLYSY
jgi:hypothetical protein